jgi:CelD/BcsL family acetyltransferase involved in cellulose biosynthesis
VSEVSWQVVSESDLDADVVSAWDRLAVARGRPYCAPVWMLSWDGEPGDGSSVRIGVVRDADRIIGIVPLIGRPLPLRRALRYELMGSGTSFRIEPLAASGTQEAVARATAELLASLNPPLALLSLRGIDAESGWSEAIAAAYPGRHGARVARSTRLPAPILRLDGVSDYEGWLRSKTRHFRKEAARSRRAFLRTGELRVASTPQELNLAMTAFGTLHLHRMRSLGRRSSLDHPSMPARLIAAGERLGPDRIRASTALVGGEIISVDLFVRAGGVTASWNGGWLESYRAFRPGWLTLLAGIEDAISLGTTEVDLGPGAYPYKYRLATRDSCLVLDRVIPRTLRSAPSYLQVIPERVREVARRRSRSGQPAPVGP